MSLAEIKYSHGNKEMCDPEDTLCLESQQDSAMRMGYLGLICVGNVT